MKRYGCASVFAGDIDLFNEFKGIKSIAFSSKNWTK